MNRDSLKSADSVRSKQTESARGMQKKEKETLLAVFLDICIHSARIVDVDKAKPSVRVGRKATGL